MRWALHLSACCPVYSQLGIWSHFTCRTALRSHPLCDLAVASGIPCPCIGWTDWPLVLPKSLIAPGWIWGHLGPLGETLGKSWLPISLLWNVREAAWLLLRYFPICEMGGRFPVPQSSHVDWDNWRKMIHTQRMLNTLELVTSAPAVVTQQRPPQASGVVQGRED